MGIVFNNAIRNAGGVPKIQATTDINTIVGQNSSLALSTANNTIYYWDPITLDWIQVAGGGVYGLSSVLAVNNNSDGVGMIISGANLNISNASLVVSDSGINGASIVNAEGYEFINSSNTITFYKVYTDPTTNDTYQKVYSDSGGTTILQPSTIGADVNVVYPNTSGQMYNLDIASITLTSGVGTYVVSGGSNNIVVGITVISINSSTSIGVNYKWSAFGTLITVTALKTNGGTETSDVSTLNVVIAK